MPSVLFNINEDIFKTVVSLFEKSEDDLKSDVALLREWCITQLHFPENLDDKRLANFIIQNKFSIERAKQKIEMYFTIRSRIDDIYDAIHPKYEHLRHARKAFYLIALPKLTEDHCRIIILKVRNSILCEKVDPINAVRETVNLLELQLNCDCWYQSIFIFDWTDIPFSFMQKFLAYFPRLYTIFQKVSALRIKSIYFLHMTPIIVSFLNLLKLLMKPKLYARIQILKSNEELLIQIPKHNLPTDIGGDEKSLEYLSEELEKKYEECAEIFDKLENLRVKEDLRPIKLSNSDTLGFHGTFKKLSVD